jgi:sodium-dependent dicarboxylate transporter 2/3/5
LYSRRHLGQQQTLMFIIPADLRTMKFLLEWKDTKNLQWGILILFGGGLCLAEGLENTHIIERLGQLIAEGKTFDNFLVLLLIIAAVFLTEVMSNVAQVIVFDPVVSSLAIALGMDPLQLGIPMTLAASCAGMLPMGTPPNAIVFASGHIRLRQMTKAGFVMNIVAIILISLFSWFLLPLLMKL